MDRPDRPHGMVNHAIFEDLQAKIDEDAKVKEELQLVVHELEKNGRITQSLLSKIHSTPSANLKPVLSEVSGILLRDQLKVLSRLETLASQHPYYKYNQTWSREVQNYVYSLLLTTWLGGPNALLGGTYAPGTLLTIEDVGNILQVPVNLKDRDVFHITIEEYLQALISMAEELTRLAVNSVTLGDFDRPILISRFVKDVHAGFQLLNLKNDSLRRRSDSMKYNVKKVEDVVYDLALRNLLPKGQQPLKD